MRNVVVIICLALVSAGVAVASPGETSKKAAWTVSKAERNVLSGATVRLATEDRAALEEELRRGMVLNQALAAEAAADGIRPRRSGRERVSRPRVCSTRLP